MSLEHNRLYTETTKTNKQTNRNMHLTSCYATKTNLKAEQKHKTDKIITNKNDALRRLLKDEHSIVGLEKNKGGGEYGCKTTLASRLVAMMTHFESCVPHSLAMLAFTAQPVIRHARLRRNGGREESRTHFFHLRYL